MRHVMLVILVGLMLIACGSKEERRDSFFSNGLKLESEGKIAEARVEAKNVIKLDPQHAGAYLLLARCALKEQNWREAFGGYMRASELDEKSTEALLGVGRLYLMSGDVKKAEDAADKILKLEPGSLDALLLRAGASVRGRQFDAAMRQLDEIFARSPGNEDAVLTKSVVLEQSDHPADAYAVLVAALQKTPESRNLLFQAAKLASKLGNLKDAETHLLALARLDPENQGIQALLASLYGQMGDTAREEDMLKNIVAKDTASTKDRLRLVDFYVRARRFDDALAVLAQAPEANAPELRLAGARVQAAAGKMDETVAALETLGADPESGASGVEAHLMLAEIKLRRGDREGALGEIDAVLKANPGDTRGHGMRGRILAMLKRYDEALAELRIAQHDVPDDAGVALLAARVQFALQNKLSGVETLQQFLTRKPESVPVRLELAAYYQREKDIQSAQNLLQEGLALGRNPQLLMAQGDLEATQQHWKGAEQNYREAAGDERMYAGALLRIGRLFAARQDWDSARGVFEELLTAKPDVHAAAEGVVATLLAQNKNAEAMAWANSRMQQRPQDPLAADLVGRLAMRMKNNDEAEKAFREAQKRAPEWSVPTARLAGLFASTNRLDEAVAESRDALSRKPDSVPEALLLGQLLLLKNDAAEAEKTYRHLLEKHPELKAAANNLAYILAADKQASSERLAEALKLATDASESGDPAALDTLGWVQYRLGDKDAAMTQIQKAYEAMPEEPSVVYHYALLLSEKGDHARAKGLLEKVVDTPGNFAEREDAKALLKSL